MTASQLVTQELQDRPPPSRPKPVLVVALLGLLLTLGGVALMLLAAHKLRDYNQGNTGSTVADIVLLLGALYPLWPGAKSFAGARRRAALLSSGDVVGARRASAAGRDEAMIAMGYAVAGMIVSGLLLMALANPDTGIVHTFFQLKAWHLSFSQMLSAFWKNVYVALLAQLIVLVFGLLLAVMRMLPGRAGAPLRLIALVYCDVFRAIPAIVTILLIVFGVPLAFPSTASWNTAWLGMIALSLTYSAYVAEVYRAGLASIHPSQSAPARSLGLSYGQTLRTVLVPQAVRRVIPPLLNDFISLQKDTALLSVGAVLEVLAIAKLYEANLFTLAPVTLAAIFFIVITIPQARFVDWLVARDARRRGAR